MEQVALFSVVLSSIATTALVGLVSYWIIGQIGAGRKPTQDEVAAVRRINEDIIFQILKEQDQSRMKEPGPVGPEVKDWGI